MPVPRSKAIRCERKTSIFRPPKITTVSSFKKRLSAAHFPWGFSLTSVLSRSLTPASLGVYFEGAGTIEEAIIVLP
jgi:hypothetical protein